MLEQHFTSHQSHVAHASSEMIVSHPHVVVVVVVVLESSSEVLSKTNCDLSTLHEKSLERKIARLRIFEKLHTAFTFK
jgi:hypothetical protein